LILPRIDANPGKTIMFSQKTKTDLLITEDHRPFSTRYLQAIYPEMSPYTLLEFQGEKRFPTLPDYTYTSNESVETLSLSSAEAIKLVEATSGVFRDFRKRE
jgi:hypothetical protein